jgi:hypothetical protein
MFMADAGLSLIACLVLLPLVLRWRRSDRPSDSPLDTVPA